LRLQPSSITGILRQQAEECPEKTAFRFLSFGDAGEEVCTFGELDRRVRAIAARLQAMNAPGARILVLQPPGLDYVAALYGCLQAGAVAVPAFPPGSSRRGARLETLVADSGATLALTSAEILQGLGPALKEESGLGALRWLAVEDLVVDSDPDDWKEIPCEPDSLALLQFTSGSTAAPRGVMLTHANILANCAAIADIVEPGPESRGVSWLPPYHDMGLIGMLLQPVYSGGEAILMSPLAFLRNPLRWLQAISDYGAEVSAGPNFAYELCTRRITPEQKEKLDLGSWRIAFNGAERVRPASLERFAAAFADCGFRKSALRPCYGLAESTLCVTARRSGPVPIRKTATGAEIPGCGPPAEGAEVRIVDPETRRPCPPGTPGEIWVAGPSVARGYWHNPRLTRETFRGEIAGEEGRFFLRTGDLGFLDAGELFVTGRIKDLIILSGENHHPEDVEAAVGDAHPLQRPDAWVAFSVDLDDREQLVVAGEVSRPKDGEMEAIAAAIREKAAEELELQVHTVLLLRPGSLPRTTSGKLQRRLCRSRFLDGSLATLACLGPAEAPRAERTRDGASALEATILAAMREILGNAEIGIHDNFFDLGGQSLLATQLLSRLRDAFGLDLPLRLVFEAPTAAGLAWRIGDLAPGSLDVPPIERVDRNGRLPLSFSQERMWFLHQLDPRNTAYNVTGALSLEGTLDVATLEKALAELLRRHEVLRTAYETREGRPFPVIRESCALPLVRADLREHADPEAEAERQASRIASEPFDLTAAPLMRMQLYRVGPRRVLLAVCMHHIVADGWSANVLLKEMLALYEAFSAGRPSPLAPETVGYVDYAAWQRRWFGGKVLERQMDFWRSRLADLPDLLALPTDRPRPRQLSTRGARIHFELPPELVERLREFGLRRDATLFMVLLGAFQTLLSRYSGQADIPVGVPIANRNWSASEGLVGTLVNTLVLRTDFSDRPGFGEVLAKVRETALSAYANQDLPFEQLVEALHPQRSLRHAPLFQVMFDYQTIPIPKEEVAGLRVRPRMIDRGAAQFELSLFVVDHGSSHTATVEYSTDLFGETTIRGMMAHYLRLLEGALERPDTPIGDLPLLSEGERRRMLEEWNDTRRPVPESAILPRAFEIQAARRPDSPAVAFEGEVLTYRALNERANRIAHRLLALGAGPGKTVAVFLERSLDLPAALLGVLKTGAAYIPLDPAYPKARISGVLEDARPFAILTREKEAQGLPLLAEKSRTLCLDVEGAALEAETAADPGIRPGPEDPAYAIFTSGSTGRPKGVRVPHRALANFLQAMRRRPGFGEEDHLLAVTTVSFDIAALELFLPLVAGGCLEILPAEICADGARLRERLEASPATVMQATPATWRLLLAAGWQGNRKLQVLCGGETLSRQLADALLSRSASLWNLYGPTETTIWSTIHRVTPELKAVPIGRPIDNTRAYVLDGSGRPALPGVTGELFLGGMGVALGYENRPEETAARFLPDPFSPEPGARMFQTGDAARFLPDGTLEIFGRLDTQVKVRGFRVELGEIESVLARHPAVAQAAAGLFVPRPGDERLAAWIVPRPGAEPAPEELRGFLKDQLPAYMVPAHFTTLAELPLTPNGKLDRKALPPPAGDSAVRGGTFVAPAGDLERALAAIWEEVLGSSPVGVTDDFFDLGGHSLLAVQAFALMQERLGLELPLAALFQATTIREIARLAREGADAGLSPSLVKIQPRGSRRPLFWVHTLGGGGGGGLLRYRDLAMKLGPDQPSLGLREPEEPFADLEAMAAFYVAEMRRFQPEGPYFLTGYCFGGNVAFEMARQLREAGERVGLLALLDSAPPPAADRGSLADPRVFFGALLRFPAWLNAFLKRDPEARRRSLRMHTRFARERLKKLVSRRNGQPVFPELSDLIDLSEYPQGFLEIARTHWRALMTHAPRPYPGDAVLFRTREQALVPGATERGWRSITKGRVEVVEVPGTHASFLEEPAVSELAAKLEARLRRAQEAASGA